MKTSLLSCLALASSFAFAAPALDTALVDRATQSPYYAPSLAILANLYSEVRQYTAVMSESNCPPPAFFPINQNTHTPSPPPTHKNKPNPNPN